MPRSEPRDRAKILRRILEQEMQRGYDDGAVIGGLERFVANWQAENTNTARDVQVLPAIERGLRDYGALEPSERASRVQSLLHVLNESPRPASPPQSGPPQRKAVTSAAKAETKVSRPRKQRGAQPKAGLDSPLTVVPMLKAEDAKRLEKLGLATLGDLIQHFPHRHIDRSSIKTIADLKPGEEVTIMANVMQVENRRVTQGRMVITEAALADKTGYIKAVWFNQPFLQRSLTNKRRVTVAGKVEISRSGLELRSPEYEFAESPEHGLHVGRLVPVYPLTANLSAKWMRRWVHSALDMAVHAVREVVPEDILKRNSLMGAQEALRQMHFPESNEQRQRAVHRLAFDEFFFIQLGTLQRRREWQLDQPGVPVRVDADVSQAFLDSLPFSLTRHQQQALTEIFADVGKPAAMNRLLQGDVGSGKTVVAAAVALQMAKHGLQSVIMAPTEVLAEQHLQTFKGFLDPFAVRSALLTGSTRKSERRVMLADLESGALDLLVGTHAVIQEDVVFYNLGLAVVDEQHRFGVRQRAVLRRKGRNPHVLVMTATPIPRSLALTLYGDLDVSTIREMPTGRLPITTRWVPAEKRTPAYAFVAKQVAQGRQAFIIFPLIEESETLQVRAAKSEFNRLQKEVFPQLKVDLLHGRLTSRQKEKVMRAFAAGETDILVSTPVVEVGIDVPNATVMMIESAERFGLAQLHQFRGRVGRGEHQSYCFLLSDSANAAENERLRILEEQRDGFALAEKDLMLRGPGEFFGTRQAGLPALKVAKLSDLATLELAREEARKLFDADPLLQDPRYAGLAQRVATFWRVESELS
ncbi:MAG: ATP-dependent DNA helicase RecG [Chloroflexi bacterium]|nr:ATP-dependent DNA helicase RecG [Chloroflexota bacterium]